MYLCNEQPSGGKNRNHRMAPVPALGNTSIRVFRNQNNRSLVQARLGMVLYRRHFSEGL